jgi:hypothetical protein
MGDNVVRVTSWPDYPVETRAALAALSRGSCYFPGCRTPIMVFMAGRPVINVDVTHIRVAEPAVDSLENLLLLCVPHSKIVAQDERAHPVDLLETWRPPYAAGLRDAVPNDRLDDLLSTAFAGVQDQIAEALSRFEKSEPESAHLIRTLMQDLSDQRRPGHLADLVTRLEAAPARTNIGWTRG